MWRGAATALLLAASAGSAEPDVTRLFAATLPTAVGDVAQWLVVSGSFESDQARGSYLLYVNPARAGVYQLMRYRVELRAPAGPEEGRRSGAERVAFIPRPGVSEPMLCWERLAGAEPAWRAIAAGTPEYQMEMTVLIRVLGVHRAARAATP